MAMQTPPRPEDEIERLAALSRNLRAYPWGSGRRDQFVALPGLVASRDWSYAMSVPDMGMRRLSCCMA